MRPHPLAIGATLLIPMSLSSQIKPTPNDDDIPKPVPVDVSLAGSELPDISRFLNVRSAFAPSLSPDGERLAFRTSITGEPQLWVVGASGGWPQQLTFGEAVTFHQWSPAGDWIIYGVDRGGNEREGYYLITPDGTKERELLAPSEAFRVFGGFTRDGRRIAYATTGESGATFDIHLIDVATGADQLVFEGRMGLYAVSWRPDNGAVILTETRGEDANDVYLFNVERGSLDTLFQPEVRSSYGGFEWLPNGRGFYLSTDQDREYQGLAYYDLAADQLTFLDTPERDVESVALSSDGRMLAWTLNDGGYSTLRLHRVSPDAATRVGEPLAPPELPRGVYGIEWATNAHVAAITIAGPQIPGDVWTWNADSGRLYRATHSSSAGLDLGQMVIPEHHSFEARDGVTIHGLLYTPMNVPARSRPPVLLSVHGGPTGQARPTFSASHQYLLTRGIAVFDLNFRGSIGYGKAFARLNDQRLRANEYLDMADAVEWLGRERLVDAERVAVAGGSYGGYLTMAAVTRLPDYFDAGVAFVGVSNWVTALEGASPQLKASDRLEYGDIDDPDDREFFREISPITHVDNVRAPVMVLHGANDPRDPVEESDQFVRAIRERGGEVQYLRFPDEGHGIRKLENRITAYRRIAEFLERVLQPARATADGQE